jgi:hypothetical protein
MQRLNTAVDLQRQTPEVVVRRWREEPQTKRGDTPVERRAPLK